MELPDGRRGRLLAAGLLVAALGVGWVAVAAPLLDWYDARAERLADRQALLLRMTRLAAELPALRRAAGSAGRDGPAPDAVLAGNSDAIAGAALQGMVQDMASAAGSTLAITETLPGQP